MALENNFSYNFWIWSKKIDPVLNMFCHLIECEIWDEEIESIKLNLISTNDEKNIWTEYLLKGTRYQIEMKLAYDAEEREDMTHIQLKTNEELKDKIEALNLFQSIFNELKS